MGAIHLLGIIGTVSNKDNHIYEHHYTMQVVKVNWYDMQEISVMYSSICRHVHYQEDDMHIECV